MLLSFILAAGLLSTELDGRWRQSCSQGYEREEFFSGDEAAFTERNFWDPFCAESAVETVSRGKFWLGKPTIPAGAQEIDFVFESVSLRPTSFETARIWSERSLCGIHDWVFGLAREVSGAQCDFLGTGSPVRIPSVGQRKFGVVLKTADRLYFGRLTRERDGSSPERRPLEIDPSPYFKSR